MQRTTRLFAFLLSFLLPNLFDLKNSALFRYQFNLSFVSEKLKKDIKEKELPTFKADCVFSLGEHCRPAHYIDKHGMRFQAAPFDWMMNYSLDEVLKQIKNNFEDFFDDIEEVNDDRKNPKNKKVKDKNGNTISMHHFPLNESAKDYKQKFKSTMKRRFAKVDSIIKKSDYIALICERGVSFDELFDFAKKFSKIYGKKSIVLFDVVDSGVDLKEFKYKICKDENITIVKFYFCDKSKGWKGNENQWSKVMSCIKLTDKGENFKKEALKNKVQKYV